MIRDDLHRDWKDIGAIATETLDFRVEFPAALDAAVGSVLLAHHADEKGIAQRVGDRPVRQVRTAGVN